MEKQDPIDVLLEELPTIIGTIGTIASGVYLVFHDVKDFGRFSDEEHPSPFHHWQIGLCFIVLGGVSLCLLIIRLLRKLGWLKDEHLRLSWTSPQENNGEKTSHS